MEGNLISYDRDLMVILDTIISKLQFRNLKRLEVSELCGDNYNYHNDAIEILQQLDLAKTFGKSDRNDYPNYNELIKTDKLDLYIKGGNSLLNEYKFEKKQRSLGRINAIIVELVGEFAYDIPYVQIKEKAQGDSEFRDFLIDEIEKQGYNIIGNTDKALQILSKELEEIDEIPYSEITSYSKKLKISEIQVIDLTTRFLGFVNIRPGDLALLQRKNLDLNSLYDKLDELTGTKNNREAQTLNDIGNPLSQLTKESFGNLLSYEKIGKKLESLIKSKEFNGIDNPSVKDESSNESKAGVEEKKSKVESPILDYEDIKDQLNQTYFRFKNKPFTPIDFNIPPCFNITPITEVLADHLNNLGNEKGGQMVGIFGRWGRGKTYLVEELQKILKKEPYQNQFIFIPFYAWKYQDTPAIWAYLYESLSEKYLGEDEFHKFFKKIGLNIHREKWGLFTDFLLLGLLWAAVTLLLSLITINSKSGFINDLLNIFNGNKLPIIAGGTIITSLIKFFKKEGQNAVDLLKKYSKEVSFSKHLGVQAEVEKEMVNLLTTWIGKHNKKRIILFVDDIDRCSEDKIIQLVDALRVMVEHEDITKRVIVLVAIDEDKLKMAIRYKYRQLLPNSKNNSPQIEKLTGEYLDKLFISGIKLQPLSKKNINEFVEKLVAENWKDETTNFVKSKDQSQKVNPEESSSSISGVVTSSPESVSEVSESVSAPSTSKKEEHQESMVLAELTAKEEIILIQEALKEIKNELTPRQVRIFYYRFQLAKNLYVKLMESEGEEVITPDLKDILTAIRMKTEKIKTETSDEDLIDQIAEMVVGY
jgi:hypothetical protein